MLNKKRKRAEADADVKEAATEAEAVVKALADTEAEAVVKALADTEAAEAVVKPLADTEAAEAVVKPLAEKEAAEAALADTEAALADTEAAVKALIKYFDAIQLPLIVGLSPSQFIRLKNRILAVYEAVTGKLYRAYVDDTDDDATIVPG